MKTVERTVITQAVLWWEDHRPLNQNEKQHLENPEVNCITETEKRLAEAVAKLLKRK